MTWGSRWGKPGKTVEAQPAIPSADEAVSVAAVQPEPSPAQPAPHITDSWGSLCEQIANALDGIPVAPLAKQSGVTVNTLVRAKSGEGIRLETLEKIARHLGWSITITDKTGKPIVRA